MTKGWLLIIAAIAVAGCARTAGVRVATAPPTEPHAEPVCIMKSPMPSAVKHRIVGQIDGSKQWYGSTSELIPLVANDARKLGADAIVNFTAGHRIGMFAWARPVVSGTAVKVDDKPSFNCIARGGELR